MPKVCKAIVLLCVMGLASAHVAQGADDPLAAGFTNPPVSARPQTWWHWMNGNITREGITADLEAMHRVGIVEANIITVYSDIPAGPVPVMSPQFFDMVQFAAKEADRLGMTLCMDNCPGWSSSGGPWVTPDKAMQFVVTSSTKVKGPAEFSQILPQPPTKLGFYRDIAVLAFRTPDGDEARSLSSYAAKVSSNSADFDAAKLLAGDSFATLPVPTADQPQYIQIEFPQPITTRTLLLTPGPGNRECSGVIQTSDDGQQFTTVRDFDIPRGANQPITLGFADPLTTRYLRLSFENASNLATGIFVSRIEFSSRLFIENIARKAVYEPAGVLPLQVEKQEQIKADPSVVVDSRAMVNLTSLMHSDGTLNWSVPDGNWTIMRLGYTPTGKTNHPAPPEATGLECDKFSRAGLDASWNGMMQPILDRLGPLGSKVLVDCLIDSYEVGGQNWTPADDRRNSRSGAGMTRKYLPVMTGVDRGEPGGLRAVLWDLRRTVSDLFADNYYGHFTELCHKHGMMSLIEPYTGPFESLQVGGRG
jgi:hypothetical protein